MTKLSDKIRREQSKFEIDIVKINQGHEVKPQKASYKKLDERIERLVSAYDSTQLEQHLKTLLPISFGSCFFCRVF